MVAVLDYLDPARSLEVDVLKAIITHLESKNTTLLSMYVGLCPNR